MLAPSSPEMQHTCACLRSIARMHTCTRAHAPDVCEASDDSQYEMADCTDSSRDVSGPLPFPTMNFDSRAPSGTLGGLLLGHPTVALMLVPLAALSLQVDRHILLSKGSFQGSLCFTIRFWIPQSIAASSSASAGALLLRGKNQLDRKSWQTSVQQTSREARYAC